MENTFVFDFLFLFYISTGGTYETYCSSGERLHTPRVGHDVCIPCLRGTFIAEEHHFFRECKPCTEIENPDVEMLVTTCNSTQDAVILCTGGFYRRRTSNIRLKDKCEKCTECPSAVRPCEEYNNTVCCPPNHDAVMSPDGVSVCKKRPIVCGAGQFFSTSSDKCLPCPAGTFMSDHSHTYKDCLKCEELSENNITQAVITRSCSRTVPTLFGCKAGYFRDPTQESLQIMAPCTPCRICKCYLIDCGMFHDAVCDDKDRMVQHAATNVKVSVGDEITAKELHDAIDAHTIISQSNKNDSELSSSTEGLDTVYVWILQLTFVTLMILSVLTLTLIIFPTKQSNLTADHTYYNTFHHWGVIEGHVHKIPRFTLCSLIVLSIFQIVVTVLNTKPRFPYASTVVYTSMTLSIVIILANAITFIVCFYVICQHRKNVARRCQENESCHLLTLDKQIQSARQTKDIVKLPVKVSQEDGEKDVMKVVGEPLDTPWCVSSL